MNLVWVFTVVTEKMSQTFLLLCCSFALFYFSPTVGKWNGLQSSPGQSLCSKNTKTFLSWESTTKANDAVLQSMKTTGAFRHWKSIQSDDIYGHFDGLH